MGLGVLLWTLLISLAHVQLNVGWGDKRQELIIGFLPVT